MEAEATLSKGNARQSQDVPSHGPVSTGYGYCRHGSIDCSWSFKAPDCMLQAMDPLPTFLYSQGWRQVMNV